MVTEQAKGKKNVILELFTNYNMFCSEEEFNEIENDLHELCQKGDTELIIIYSKLIKQIEQNHYLKPKRVLKNLLFGEQFSMNLSSIASFTNSGETLLRFIKK